MKNMMILLMVMLTICSANSASAGFVMCTGILQDLNATKYAVAFSSIIEVKDDYGFKDVAPLLEQLNDKMLSAGILGGGDWFYASDERYMPSCSVSWQNREHLNMLREDKIKKYQDNGVTVFEL